MREEDESGERWRFEKEDIDFRRYVKFVRILRIVGVFYFGGFYYY